jgi:hypothetical protein
MDIALKAEEWKLLKWLHHNAKGYSSEHMLVLDDFPADPNEQEVYDRAISFLSGFDLVKLGDISLDPNRSTTGIWITAKGENFYRNWHDKYNRVFGDSK